MSLDEAALIADVRSRLFAPSSDSRTVGAELELIPRYATTNAPVPAGGHDSLSAVIREIAESLEWREMESEAGPPAWDLPDGGRISFEPGGQIEISSPPLESCSGLIQSLQAVTSALTKSACAHGIELLATGVDPHNDIDAVPLQLVGDRYVRMNRYFAARGKSGVRMMRQTAALQISVEHGPNANERWTLLNALAPYLIAIFATSARYAGRDTGHASYRAHLWRELDPSRTGIPFDSSDAAARYARFALDAGAIRAESGTGEFHSFRSMIDDPSIGMSDWEFHLSTLFPEIRPKEYFEIRSLDAVPFADIAAPLTFVCGIVYDPEATREAVALLGSPDESLLRVAGEQGLGDPKINSISRALVDVALAGAARLPAEYLSPNDRRDATEWLREKVNRPQ
ncbi:MAG: glutamate-cysteine ligase family protein [Gemmatimonadota bacterium]|nr:glutamate-cysteine ligase family protein [Gemmatimonadota bacterium]